MLVCLYAWASSHPTNKQTNIYTLEIVARILSYRVNIDRLCGTNALLSVASAIFEAVKPIEEVPTQSICVWFVGFFFFVCLFVGIKLEKL